MKKLHVASFSGRSGVSKYASDFFDLVLRDRGYERLDCGQLGEAGAKAINLDDLVHFEIGINEEAEIKLLYHLIKHGHRNIDVTLHDPPFIRWPYFRFQNQLLNSTSKFIHLYLRNIWIGESPFHKARRFFVLTQRGCRSMRRRYDLKNVFFLPFVLNPKDISEPGPMGGNMLFFGYIAKNKGLDYALALHEGLRADYPQSRFLVIGDAAPAREAADFLCQVKERYSRNVDYLDYVEDLKLGASFDRASIAILPFSAYRSVIPASASVLKAMAMGKVVFATNVNAVAEYIRDGETGYLLTGNFEKDLERLRGIMRSPCKLEAVARAAVSYLRQHHNPKIVGEAFDRANQNDMKEISL
jgi:glycosyltransferase involved in cell wall biosynthesis